MARLFIAALMRRRSHCRKSPARIRAAHRLAWRQSLQCKSLFSNRRQPYGCCRPFRCACRRGPAHRIPGAGRRLPATTPSSTRPALIRAWRSCGRKSRGRARDALPTRPSPRESAASLDRSRHHLPRRVRGRRQGRPHQEGQTSRCCSASSIATACGMPSPRSWSMRGCIRGRERMCRNRRSCQARRQKHWIDHEHFIGPRTRPRSRS